MNTKISTGTNLGIPSALVAKPIADIVKIIEQISPYAKSFQANKGKFCVIITAINAQSIYFIREA